MRNCLHSKFGRPHVGWLFWPLALLILPNCSFDRTGVAPEANPLPHTSLIFCDIERPLQRHCATDIEKATGVRQNAAAVALVAGQSGGAIGLDESPAARARCGGEPEAVTFQGPFPTGNPLCLNGFAIGLPADPDIKHPEDPPFVTADAACAFQCENLFGHFDESGAFISDFPPDPSVKAFCEQRAHTSTNVPVNVNIGFAGGCTPGGMQRPDFADPRRVAEPVIWRDTIGTTANGNNLTRTAPTSPPPNNEPFDAGAASTRTFMVGDAYVEFSAAETNLSHVCGLSQLMGPDSDPSLTDIGFGLSLNKDGRYFVLEAGNLVPGPDVNLSFGTYSVGERFRVTATDNANGAATITYSRIVGACVPGMPCAETVFHTSTRGPATYPFRVDASFREQGATLTDVRIVRSH